MSRLQRNFLSPLLLAGALLFGAPSPAEDLASVTVYKTPRCGCCVKWVEHLEANGFRVESRNLPDLRALKASHGVPAGLTACHTALVDGYVVEGHVPASDVARLLEERPPIRGIAVPGMPIGSPGMEGPNPEAYRVLSFDNQGRVAEFSAHGP